MAERSIIQQAELEKRSLTQAEIQRFLRTVEQKKRERIFDYFTPYAKQRRFIEMGRTKRERLFSAGNQVGKSHTGAFEAAAHLTGEYPDWWPGREFHHPTKGWVAGETSTVVRDVQQKKLCGEPGVEALFGTGLIPKARFVDLPTRAKGVSDAYDTIQVEHSNWEVKKKNYIRTRCVDGVSLARFKSYEQGRAKFQGETIDFGWGDEEPDMELYEEFVARLTGPGMIFTTFTPLQGKTELVLHFEDPKCADDCGVVFMTLDEAEHFTPEEKAKRLAGYRKHMRDARAKGIPVLGSGRIFEYDEELISEPTILNVPLHWKKIWGLDFGIGHPFAAVLIAWDVDNDVIHVLAAIRMVDDERASLPMHHARAMLPLAGNVPVAWPQDGTQREKGSGDPLAHLYRREGLKMLYEHATWEDGSTSTEAGITMLDTYMMTGRFKVAKHLGDWFEEYREYHRKDGKIVKIRDDLMSATRIAVMMKRFARPVPLGSRVAVDPSAPPEIADGVDFDLF